ncbi:uncharacterized protein LOC126779563 isoform X2 [Nymphalis io]|uniref:uncharacterized protein LOC126779563 isoform X2 n=1 Tax=Inachis io TaxID=171585 RepID=UPI00216A0C7F|nr:uncharacterized protein LOC126779563 isoform X2 [Nymphalis io]
MWRSSKQEWERRKTYLIRSLFEDIPMLSPINESEEPTLLSPSDEIYRPESPLPDLIIEKEPRKYLEDETEEFYNKLAKEMRRLYKRDFLNIDYDTLSCDSTGLESGDDNLMQQGTSFDTENRILASDKFIQEAILDKEEYSPQTTSDETNQEATRSTSCNSESTESEENSGHEQIITKADVHTVVVKMSKQSLHESDSSKEWDKSSQSYLTKQTDTSSSSMRSEQSCVAGAYEIETRQGVEKELAKTTASARSSSPVSHNETPEIMRRLQTICPEDSLPHHEVPICESIDRDISESFGIEIANVVASGSEMELADSSVTDFNILCTVTSTPKSLKKVSSPRSRIIKKHRKRLVSYSSSSSGSKDAKRQAALQTSFSDDEPAWNLWNNFFVGIPTVYNICSCNNHVCS